MSTESIIFFVLALMVWGLSVGARWLQTQMEKNSTDGMEFEPIDWSSSAELEAAPQAQPLVATDEHQQSKHLTPKRWGVGTRKEGVKRFGLDRPQNLRQGIILMTVLGPCRALEQPNDSRPF